MKLWNRSAFLNHHISDGILIVDWVKQKNYSSHKEKTASQILKNLITRTSLFDWNDADRKLIADFPLIGIQFGESQEISEGLKIACLYRTVAVSLHTNEFWNTPYLKLMWLDENDDTIAQDIFVKHATLTTHLDEHQEWLLQLKSNELILSSWNPSEVYFPCIDYSNLLVSGDWSQFYKHRSDAKNKEEIRAIIVAFGKMVAERNFYEYDQKVSSINTTGAQKRIIYSAGIGKERIYLSIDLEHGGFEICNYKGMHLGEYFFDGNKKSDYKSGHDINVKS
jgi:hypothetical protein